MKSTDFPKGQTCGKPISNGAVCALRAGHEYERTPWPGFVSYCMADACPRQHIGGTGMGICVYCLHEDQANLRSKYEALAADLRHVRSNPLQMLRAYAIKVGTGWLKALVADRLRP